MLVARTFRCRIGTESRVTADEDNLGCIVAAVSAD